MRLLFLLLLACGVPASDFPIGPSLDCRHLGLTVNHDQRWLECVDYVWTDKGEAP